jgi:amino-acid N-acetyltransferase
MNDAAIDDTKIRPAGSADFPSIAALVLQAGLPLAGAEDHLNGFVVAERNGSVIGCAGLERHADAALLRSVAVAATERSRGLGGRLVAACLDRARGAGLVSVALLTETADGWFPRFGFTPVERGALPASLSASEELRGACPDSARAMLLELKA